MFVLWALRKGKEGVPGGDREKITRGRIPVHKKKTMRNDREGEINRGQLGRSTSSLRVLSGKTNFGRFKRTLGGSPINHCVLRERPIRGQLWSTGGRDRTKRILRQKRRHAGLQKEKAEIRRNMRGIK